MRRLLACLAKGLLSLLIAVPASQAAAGDAPLTCKRVALVDAESGAAIQGAEDLALDREAGQLFISAYDRWAVEDAARANARTLPQGGLYAVSLTQLAESGDGLRLRNLTAAVKGPMQPHGLGFHHGGERRRLFAVNHAFAKVEGEWRKQARVDVFAVEGAALEPVGQIAGEALCNANDVTPISGERALVTLDRDACAGFDRLVETVAGLRRAKVVLVELDGETEGSDGAGERGDGEGGRGAVETLLDGIGFANGIALAPDGRTLAVAATREQAVRFYDLPLLLDGKEGLIGKVSLSGGPDNVSWGRDGRLLAAVHPSLIRSGMARHRWFGRKRAGSRIVAIEFQDSETATLVDDPDGERLNMATSVVEAQTETETGPMLIASGVLDSALLVCRPPG